MRHTWRGRTAAVAFLVALGSLAVAPAQAATTLFYETMVVTDDEADYDLQNGALDIVAVHMSERYQYDAGNRSGVDTVQFRVELRSRDQIKDMPPQGAEGTEVTRQPIDFVLGFKADGRDVQTSVRLTQVCEVAAPPAGSGLDCTRSPTVPKPHFTTQSGGVVIVLARDQYNLSSGTTITNVWVASSTNTQDGIVYHDVAPKDNANQPQGPDFAVPTTPDTAHTLAGTFPFLRMNLLTSAKGFATPGGEASWVFEFRTHNSTNGLDRVFIDVEAPAGWTFEGNLGTDFITTAGDQRIEYEITAKAPAVASAGTKVPIRIKATMQGFGGHQEQLVNVEIAGARVESPDYNFTLLTPGPFEAERVSTFRWAITHLGDPLAAFQVSADFILNSQVVHRGLTAVEEDSGTYVVNYTFASGGLWTVDVYISEFQPSPHDTFPVEVQSADGGFLPGFELFAVLAAAGIALLRRRL